jgi:uncharacterized protein (DUF2147 family)
MSLMRITITMIAMVISFSAAQAMGSSVEDSLGLLGIWNNEDGRAKIDIFDCGGHFCGRIVWLKEPNYPHDDKSGMGGKHRMDLENPSPELRSRPLMGLQIMEGFDYVGNGVWDKGRIYDPESGKTYKGKITLASPHRLLLRGYIGIPLFGRTSVWAR